MVDLGNRPNSRHSIYSLQTRTYFLKKRKRKKKLKTAVYKMEVSDFFASAARDDVEAMQEEKEELLKSISELEATIASERRLVEELTASSEKYERLWSDSMCVVSNVTQKRDELQKWRNEYTAKYSKIRDEIGVLKAELKEEKARNGNSMGRNTSDQDYPNKCREGATKLAIQRRQDKRMQYCAARRDRRAAERND